MTEKEKNILEQELWALVSLSFEATKHDFEIMGKMLKCVSREDPGEMTPGKRKVIEELQLQWRFMKTLHEDIGKIAARLGGFNAYGPILLGLNAPINDLSRGCNAEEVYKMAIITAALI